nr:cytochrome P450 [Streptomyces sp. HNM0575]
MSEFTVRQAESLRPRIEEIVDRQIDELLASGPPADLAHHVSHTVSSLVICEFLGTPPEDSGFVRQRTSTILNRSTSAAEHGAATDELLLYFEQLVEAKQRNPGDDAFSRIIEKNQDTGVFDRDLLVALMVLLLMGGHETTGEMISLGTVGLLTFPDQLAKVRTDPALIPDAVEELLRFFSVSGGTLRVAKEDITVGGVEILAGDGIMLHLATAARDPHVFAHPDELDVTRGARNHLAFGHGAHQCIGQNLARVVIEVALARLFERIPTLRLCEPLTKMSFKTDSLLFGMYRLAVSW